MGEKLIGLLPFLLEVFMAIPSLQQIFEDPTRKLMFAGKLLALDPGETTGYAVFNCSAGKSPILEDCGHIDTSGIESAVKHLTMLLNDVRPDRVVLEDYRVYAAKTEQHTYSNLMTPQMIGIILAFCEQRKIGTAKQMASLAKGFCTDDKLKFWKMYIRGKKHARDAIRHGIYYLLFTYASQTKKEEKLNAKRN